MNSLNLKQIDGGNIIKQADSGSLFKFELLDENHKKFEEQLGDTATVILKKDTAAVFKKIVAVTDNCVAFNLDKILEVGDYILEIIVGSYVFPSNNRLKISVESTYGDYQPENLVRITYEEIDEKINKLKDRLNDLNVAGQTEMLRRIEKLEAKEDSDTIYDDSELVSRVTALEQKEDHDTIYDDTEIKQSVADVDTKVDNLSEKVTALEERPTVDTALTKRVEALERKEDKDTVYDDTPIIKRIETLEDKPDNDTIYDDSNLKAQIAELETALSTLVRKRPPMSFYIDRSDTSNMKAVFDNGCVMINFPIAVYNYFYGYPGSHDGRSFHYYNLPGNLIKVAIGIVGIDSLKEEGISNAIYYCNNTKILNPIYDSSQFNFDELVIREPTDNKDFKLACQRNFVKIAYEIGALNESEIIKLGATKK